MIVFEELHNSRAAQIQEAIALVRLHDHHALRHIALEGYRQDEAPIKSDWYDQAVTRADSRTGPAVELLKEGEISSAEFMKLAYADMKVDPIEKSADYNVEEPNPIPAFNGAVSILNRVALKSIPPQRIAPLVSRIRQIKQLQGAPRARAQSQLMQTILAGSPWAKATLASLRQVLSGQDVDLEHEVKLFNGIKQKAQAQGIVIDPKDEQALDQFLAFLQARQRASQTMAAAAGQIADQPDVSVLAMIVGEGHTHGVCQQLAAAGRPYALLQPKALANKQDPSSLSSTMSERKYHHLSIFSDDVLGRAAKKAFSNNGGTKKYPTVLNEEWLQGKATMYGYIDEITRRLLPESGGGSTGGNKNNSGNNNNGGGHGGGGGAGGGGGGTGNQPPWGFRNDDFRSRLVFIDPHGIRKVDHGRALIIRVTLNPDDPARRQTIYVKSARGRDADVPPGEKEPTERMLKDALHEVEAPERSYAEHPKGATHPGDEAGRIKISRETVAAFAASEGDAERAQVIRL
ncbi:MAG: hypothetical protein JO250_20510 [Armatimonadetes bacterium]|nr:hypothetical protein [Armatimonadota bacterium]